jgi:hypothetical protein
VERADGISLIFHIFQLFRLEKELAANNGVNTILMWHQNFSTLRFNNKFPKSVSQQRLKFRKKSKEI